MSARGQDPDPTRSIVVGVTGASGIIYARRLVRVLLESAHEVHLVVSQAGRLVLAEEASPGDGDPWAARPGEILRIYPEKDWMAPFASGSFRFRGMVVVPASMGSIGAIASGTTINLIHRAADVALKEKRPLVLVPRETPFSVIHLENLLRLARAGAVILPPSPAFYQHPRTIEDQVDFVVSRILDALDIPNRLFRRWHESSP